MINFKQFLVESTPTGNYVCINAENQSDIWKNNGLTPPESGVAPPDGDYHCTLIYSENSSVNYLRIKDDIQTAFPNSMVGIVTEYACFDSQEKDKSCIVAKIENPLLQKIHDYLRSFGLQHSYDQFEPHVTIRYNMTIPEAHKYRDLLNSPVSPRAILLKNYKSAPIDKNYV